MNMVKCLIECAPGHHSMDQVLVYMGAADPLLMCGYHAERFVLGESIRELNEFYAWLDAPIAWVNEARDCGGW